MARMDMDWNFSSFNVMPYGGPEGSHMQIKNVAAN